MGKRIETNMFFRFLVGPLCFFSLCAASAVAIFHTHKKCIIKCIENAETSSSRYVFAHFHIQNADKKNFIIKCIFVSLKRLKTYSFFLFAAFRLSCCLLSMNKEFVCIFFLICKTTPRTSNTRTHTDKHKIK